jgi:TolB-like protein/DNA-binding winged helix-turn-helix (wHTH) protein/Tfp pilus assembly protein PilF
VAAHAPEDGRILEFDDGFRVDLRARQLDRAGRAVKLERIPTDVLLLLLERAGDLVTREEITHRVWGSDVFLDVDNSINGAIRKIRQALRDNPDRPRYIQTVTGRGYRFIAPVRERGPEAAPDAVPERTDASPPAPPSRNLMLAAALVFIGIAVGGALLAWRLIGAQQAPQGKVMLAVLPIANLTGDPVQDYFSEGLTEEMIARLGKLAPDRLGVIARASVMRYKDAKAPLASLERDLGVRYALEGSVRREGTILRFVVRLVRLPGAEQIWAGTYERDVNYVFAVQDEIAQAVADEIKITVAGIPRDSNRPAILSSSAYRAYDAYLKGRYFWNKRTPEGFRAAIESFNESIAADPQFAPAHAGLADTYALLGTYNLAPPEEALPTARAAAVRALQLDDTLAEAHTSLGLIALFHDWDWSTAEAEYRRAIELNPNYATAHHWYAECLAFQGRFDEALASSERARQLDPLSLIIATDNGAILYFARQYDRAIAQLKNVLRAEPAFPRANGLIVFAYTEKGMFDAALDQIRQFRLADDSTWTYGSEAYALARAGRPAEAQRALAKYLDVTAADASERPWMVATVQAALGDRDPALAGLQEALRIHSGQIAALAVDPVYDALRDDGRFRELLRQAHLGSTFVASIER